MSPRAAWRLESLGFKNVYDYTAGKLDWIGAGLPLEARAGGPAFVLDFIHRDAPTCSLTDHLSDIPRNTNGFSEIVVVNYANAVLGVVAKDQLPGKTDETAEHVMNPAPTTFRPTGTIEEATAFMGRYDLAELLVTTSEGKLVGLLNRQTAERAVHESSLRT